MGKLEKSLCYLSGPMDFAKDHGIGWRQQFIKLVAPLGINCLDPTNKPVKIAGEVGEEKNHFHHLKEMAQWSELRKFAKEIRRYDLRFVDLSDFCVAYVDTSVYSFGTIDEIITCERQKKPVIGIFPQGLKKAPLWAFAIFRPEEMFEGIADAVDYLKKVSNNEIVADSRWVLIRQYMKG